MDSDKKQAAKVEEDIKQLQEIASQQGVASRIKDDRLVIGAAFLGNPVEIAVYFEKNNYQVKVDDLLTLDKIEDQNLSTADVEDLFKDFLSALTGERCVLIEHIFLGKKACSLTPELNKHTAYQTLSEAVILRFGKITNKSPLKIPQESE